MSDIRADRTSDHWLTLRRVAFREGRTAFGKGAPKNDNPYLDAGELNSLHDNWNVGWQRDAPPGRYMVGPGRHIYRDGKEFIAIRGHGDTPHVEADSVTRHICRLLNENERKDQ